MVDIISFLTLTILAVVTFVDETTSRTKKSPLNNSQNVDANVPPFW